MRFVDENKHGRSTRGPTRATGYDGMQPGESLIRPFVTEDVTVSELGRTLFQLALHSSPADVPNVASVARDSSYRPQY